MPENPLVPVVSTWGGRCVSWGALSTHRRVSSRALLSGATSGLRCVAVKQGIQESRGHAEVRLPQPAHGGGDVNQVPCPSAIQESQGPSNGEPTGAGFLSAQAFVKEQEIGLELLAQRQDFPFSRIEVRKRAILPLDLLNTDPGWRVRDPVADRVRGLRGVQFMEDRLRDDDLCEERGQYPREINQDEQDEIVEWGRIGNDNHVGNTRSSAA